MILHLSDLDNPHNEKGTRPGALWVTRSTDALRQAARVTRSGQLNLRERDMVSTSRALFQIKSSDTWVVVFKGSDK